MKKHQPIELSSQKLINYSDSVVDSIISFLGKDPLISDLISSESDVQRQSEKHSQNINSSDSLEELDSKRTKKS